MTSRRRFLLSTSTLALAGIGCGDDDASGGGPTPNTQQTFVGDVTGTETRVALVRDGDDVALFFCGGATTFATATRWVRAQAQGDTFDVTADGWAVHVSIQGGLVTGTLDTGDGVAAAWQGSRVDEAGLAGLYEAEQSDGNVGVVVALDEAGAALVQGALVTPTVAAQVVPIAPVERVADRMRVTVLFVDGPKDVTVRRAVARAI